jgi:hypothetical protein
MAKHSRDRCIGFGFGFSSPFLSGEVGATSYFGKRKCTSVKASLWLLQPNGRLRVLGTDYGSLIEGITCRVARTIEIQPRFVDKNAVDTAYLGGFPRVGIPRV